jgi:hypothetical protein
LKPILTPLTATRAGVVVSYGLALAAAVVSFSGNDLSFGWRVLHTGVIVLVFALPPTMAALALPHRPLLLLGAGVSGILGLIALGSVLAAPMLVPGLVWLVSYFMLGGPGRWGERLTMAILVPLLWVGASASLWLHADPVCERTFASGRVESVDPASRGMRPAWLWDIPAESSGSSSLPSDAVKEVCDSNAVVWWEAAAALVLTLAALVLALRTAAPAAVPARAGR